MLASYCEASRRGKKIDEVFTLTEKHSEELGLVYDEFDRRDAAIIFVHKEDDAESMKVDARIEGTKALIDARMKDKANTQWQSNNIGWFRMDLASNLDLDFAFDVEEPL